MQEEIQKVSPIKRRILAFAETLGISKREFYTRIGVSRGTLESNTGITEDVMAKFIAEFPNISPEWLLTGNGPMLYSDKKEITKPCIDDNSINIPIVDILAAAGSAGCINSNYIDVIDNVHLPQSMIKKDAIYYCIRVKGESMSPTLLDSGYIIIRYIDRNEWVDIPDQHICVVSDTQGKAYIKRLKNRLSQYGFIVCMSDNPDKYCYPNFNLQENEINTIWHAEWYFSAKMPNIHETYYNKIGEMQDDIDLLKNQYSNIMKSLNNPK